MAVDVVRADWEEGLRRLESERGNPRRYHRLLGAVEAVSEELRARIGQTFTVEQLAAAYADVERWGREAVAERAPYDGWTRDLALIEDAAFAMYARGASDYAP